MKKYKLLSVIVIICVMTAQGQKPFKLKSSKVTIDGTSSMHEWTSEVTKLEWTGNITTEGGAVKEIKDVVVKIPVVSIKSTKGKTMDNKTYEAFKSDKNPTITYQLSGVVVKGTALQATGSLTMAGAAKTISMTVSAKVLANGDVQLTGSQKLNMKDFKMSPPTAVMGTIKVGEEVTVKYDLVLSP